MVHWFTDEVIFSSDWLSEHTVLQLISDVCAVKARIVEADELEKGVRKV